MCVSDALVRPDLPVPVKLLFDSVRKSALNELNRFFERNLISQRDQQMEVVWHHNVFMEQKAGFRAILLKHIDEQCCHDLGLQAPALKRDFYSTDIRRPQRPTLSPGRAALKSRTCTRRHFLFVLKPQPLPIHLKIA
jgi:hypothetical protein